MKFSGQNKDQNSAEHPWGLAALQHWQDQIRRHYSKIADRRDTYIRANEYYFNYVTQMLRFVVEPSKRVLQLGSQTGYILSALEPSEGVGLDVTKEFVDIAKKKHPSYSFELMEGNKIPDMKPFDYVLFSNIGEVMDVSEVLREVKTVCSPETLIVISNYNHIWEPIFILAQKLGFKFPLPDQNWLSLEDVENFLLLNGLEPLKIYRGVLFPKYLPILSKLLNDILAKLPLIRKLCMTNMVVAREIPKPLNPSQYSASVIIPCKNEEGNIENAVRRIPDFSKHVEIIFCDDKSEDGTKQEIIRIQKLFSNKDIKLLDGPGVCKSQNVWTGFEAAHGDVLMILDADLTVMPEELPQFFNALVEGRGQMINGSRMIYPTQDESMRFLNIYGNIGFSWLFTFILGQRITDTLCGTKVFWRNDWPRIKQMIGTWGINDRWGDYELLFGAAKLHLKIIDLPVHYQRRVEGETKMTHRFQNALIMFRMCFAAFKKFKFF